MLEYSSRSSKDIPLGEKAAAWLLTTAIKVKSKMGAGGGHGKRKRRASKKGHQRKRAVSFGAIVRQARAAIKGSGFKSSTKDVVKNRRQIHLLAKAAVKAARQMRKGKRLRSVGKSIGGSSAAFRQLPLPKSGGVLPLIPLFAGLSAIGSLAGGASGVYKAIAETKDAKRRLAELKRHNQTMEDIALRKGKGLFLSSKNAKGGLGLFMAPYTQHAKNC